MTDEYLLAALRMAAGADPMPSDVSAAARAAFALRVPGGIAAGGTVVTGAGGARSGGRSGAGPGEIGPRMHRFTADGLTIDVEPMVLDDRMAVAGQISPPPGPGWRVEVRTPQARATRACSANGQFVVGDLPVGWLSVVCHRPGRPPVFTRWLHVRP